MFGQIPDGLDKEQEHIAEQQTKRCIKIFPTEILLKLFILFSSHGNTPFSDKQKHIWALISVIRPV